MAVALVGLARLAPLRERQVAAQELHLVLRAEGDASGDRAVDVGPYWRRREQAIGARHAAHGARRVKLVGEHGTSLPTDHLLTHTEVVVDLPAQAVRS